MGGRSGARGAAPSQSEELYARLEWLAAAQGTAGRSSRRELEDSAIGAMIKMAPQDPDPLLEEIAEQLLAEVAEREARARGAVASRP